MGKYAWVLGIILLFLGFYLLFNPTNNEQGWAPDSLDYDPYEGWVSFSKEGLFEVKFPFYPQNARETMRDGKTQERRFYNMFVAQSTDGKLFMVSVVSFPDQKNRVQGINLARALVMEMVTGKDNLELKAITPFNFKGKEALKFQTVSPSATTQGIVIPYNDKIYLLSEVAPGQLEPVEFSYFSDSFKFLGEANEAQ